MPSRFTEKKSLSDKMRFMHKFSASLNIRWSPRFAFSAEIILVTSYIKVLLFPWYLQKGASVTLFLVLTWEVFCSFYTCIEEANGSSESQEQAKSPQVCSAEKHFSVPIATQKLTKLMNRFVINQKVKEGAKLAYSEMRTEHRVRGNEQQSCVCLYHCNARNNQLPYVLIWHKFILLRILKSTITFLNNRPWRKQVTK